MFTYYFVSFLLPTLKGRGSSMKVTVDDSIVLVELPRRAYVLEDLSLDE